MVEKCKMYVNICKLCNKKYKYKSCIWSHNNNYYNTFDNTLIIL